MSVEKELPQTNNETYLKEEETLDELNRKYRIYEIPENSFLREKLGVDRLRVYDKDLLVISREINRVYVTEKSRLLRSGEVLTYAEQWKIANERGLWTDDDEKKLSELAAAAKDALKEYEYAVAKHQEADESERANYIDDVENAHQAMIHASEKYLELLTIKLSVFSHTVEMLAAEKQKLAALSMAVCYDDGDDNYDQSKRVWKSIEELEEGDYTHEDLSDLIIFAEGYWNMTNGVDIPFFGGSRAEKT